ncbi:MAG: hypothetical protein ACOYCB_12975 [Fastidiosipilaceae bacterium]|jgi:hypothetical protein
MNSLNKALFLGLIVSLYNLILELQHSQEVSVPTGWGVGIDIGRQYILWNGHIIDEFSCNYVTWQSGLSQYGGQDVLSKIFFAEVNLVSGCSEFPSGIDFINSIPIATLFLVLSVLAIYAVFSKYSETKRLKADGGLTLGSFWNPKYVGSSSLIDYIILLSICVFPLHTAIMPGSINGTFIARAFFVFLMLCFITLLLFPKEKRCMPAVIIFLLFPYYIWYHTWTYYALLCFITIFILAFVLQRKAIVKLSVIGVFFYFVTGIYHNYHQLIEQPTLMAKAGFEFLTVDLSGKTEVAAGFKMYQSLQTIHSVLQLISVIIILTILLITLIECLIKVKNNQNSEVEYLAICIIFSIPLVGMFLFVQGGIGTLIGRLFEYALYIYLICSAYLLSPMGQRKVPKWMIQALLLFTVVICLVSIPLSESSATGLNYQEYGGISFFGTHTGSKAPIFSDFRLGTPFIYYSKEAIYTIDSPKQSRTGDFASIMEIYYNETSPYVVLDKVIPDEQYYVLTSKRQSIIGLKDTSFAENLQPAQQDFQKNFERDSHYEKLYSSGGANIYLR